MLPSTADTEARAPKNAEAPLPLEMVELALSLDGFNAGPEGFADAVRDAARSVGGDFLFDLPASDLADDCQRIAALRIPDVDGQGLQIVFALLDKSATAIRIEDPGERTEGLKRFAEAFVGVLQHM
ncbi:hypothetical protein [Sinorhizobium sp. BG8]|uniref:hypothetical protein n=1 Tax=Sinorhizobium sp. BG8 TaxID=2613773 RepID=UPI001FEF768B|nr:hypothetical protein [Sinorhizobium sp. BG8]